MQLLRDAFWVLNLFKSFFFVDVLKGLFSGNFNSVSIKKKGKKKKNKLQVHWSKKKKKKKKKDNLPQKEKRFLCEKKYK